MIVLDDGRQNLERWWEHVEYLGASAPNPYALEQQVSFSSAKGKEFDSWAGLWPKHWR